MVEADGDLFPSRTSSGGDAPTGARRPGPSAGEPIVGPGRLRRVAPGALMVVLTLLIFTEGRVKRWVLASIGGGWVLAWLVDRGE